jgi:hypothetical protein
MNARTGSLKRTMVGLLRMSRPGPLVAALLAWLLGASILYGKGSRFGLSSFVLGFASVLMVILSLHYANEYADYETDSLTRRTLYSGGSGVLPSGLVVLVWDGRPSRGRLLRLHVFSPTHETVVSGPRRAGQLVTRRSRCSHASLHQSGWKAGRIYPSDMYPFTLVFNNLLASTWRTARQTGSRQAYSSHTLE